MRWVDAAGVRLHVESEGAADDPPVVLVHGLASVGATWGWLPPSITSGRHVLRPDLRGHGRSARAPGAYTLDHLVADVLAVLHRSARRPAVLVGHSLGGVVAWTLAQRHPEAVAAVLLEDPPLLLPASAGWPASPFHRLFSRLRAGTAVLRALGLSAAQISAELRELPTAEDPAVRLGSVLADDALAAMGAALHGIDLECLDRALDGTLTAGTDVVSPLRAPVTIVAAGRGSALPPDDERVLLRRHPGLRVVRLAGSGHLIHDERAHRAAFTAHLERFLHRHAPADRSRAAG